MHPRTREVLEAFLRYCEGTRSVMYLDSRGLVTTGVGFLIHSIPEAQALAWTNPAARRRATASEVADEWRRIRDGGDPAASPLRLDPTVIDTYFETKINESERMLEGCFPGFDTFPADAQLGMLAHSWWKASCQGIQRDCPNYFTACRSRNWQRAGGESLWGVLVEALRRGRPERRVNRARGMLRMFENAAVVEEARRQGLGIPLWPFYPRDASHSYPRISQQMSRERHYHSRYPPAIQDLGDGLPNP